MSGHQVAACENSPRRTYTPDFAPRSLGTPTAGSRLPGSRAACDRPYLGLHQPAGDGGLPIVARPELQGHGAGADVGDAQVRGGPWEFCRRKTGQGERWPTWDGPLWAQRALCCTFPRNLRGAAWRGLTPPTQASSCTPGSPHSQQGPETGVGAERSSRAKGRLPGQRPGAGHTRASSPGVRMCVGCSRWGWRAHKTSRAQRETTRTVPLLDHSNPTGVPPKPKTGSGRQEGRMGAGGSICFLTKNLGVQDEKKEHRFRSQTVRIGI